MHDQPTRGPALSAAENEDEMQIAALRFLLDPRPVPLTLDELLTEFLGLDDGTFTQRDRIRNAVRDLACAGLAHRHGEPDEGAQVL